MWWNAQEPSAGWGGGRGLIRGRVKQSGYGKTMHLCLRSLKAAMDHVDSSHPSKVPHVRYSTAPSLEINAWERDRPQQRDERVRDGTWEQSGELRERWRNRSKGGRTAVFRAPWSLTSNKKAQLYTNAESSVIRFGHPSSDLVVRQEGWISPKGTCVEWSQKTSDWRLRFRRDLCAQPEHVRIEWRAQDGWTAETQPRRVMNGQLKPPRWTAPIVGRHCRSKNREHCTGYQVDWWMGGNSTQLKKAR